MNIFPENRNRSEINTEIFKKKNPVLLFKCTTKPKNWGNLDFFSFFPQTKRSCFFYWWDRNSKRKKNQKSPAEYSPLKYINDIFLGDLNLF